MFWALHWRWNGRLQILWLLYRVIVNLVGLKAITLSITVVAALKSLLLLHLIQQQFSNPPFKPIIFLVLLFPQRWQTGPLTGLSFSFPLPPMSTYLVQVPTQGFKVVNPYISIHESILIFIFSGREAISFGPVDRI